MSSQIFKKNVPNELLFNLLDKIGVKNEKNYVFNINTYKKGVFHELIQKFLDLLERRLVLRSKIIHQVSKIN